AGRTTVWVVSRAERLSWNLVWGSLTAVPRGAFPRGGTPRPPGHVLALASSSDYATRGPTHRGIHVERRSWSPWQGWARKTVPFGHKGKFKDRLSGVVLARTAPT